jgi:hypothetical protein
MEPSQDFRAKFNLGVSASGVKRGIPIRITQGKRHPVPPMRLRLDVPAGTL